MAHIYPAKARNNDGTYGPTGRRHYYKPASYHNPTAKKRADKTRWMLREPQQYEVFRVADEDYENYIDGQGGMYGFLDKMQEVLGKDNEERIAYFPNPGTNPWHGYPIDSEYIEDDIIERWNDNGLITKRVYIQLSKHRI